MIIQEKFIFKLSSELEYQDKNGNNTTDEITLKAPVSKHEEAVCKLQQAVMKSMLVLMKISGADKNKPDTENEIINPQEEDKEKTADSYIHALKAGCDNLYELKQVFYNMISNDLAYIAGSSGDERLTKTLIGDLSLSDKDKLLGQYLANFIPL